MSGATSARRCPGRRSGRGRGCAAAIAGAACAVPEAGGHEPLGLHQLLPVFAATDVGRLGRQMIDHAGNGPVMGRGHDITNLGRPERPQKRYAFRSGERQVESGPSVSSAHDAQVLSGTAPAIEQVAQDDGIRHSGQTESGRGGTDPLSRGLAVTLVVVVDRVGHMVEVVVGPRGHAQTTYREHGGGHRKFATRGDRSMGGHDPDHRHLGRHPPRWRRCFTSSEQVSRAQGAELHAVRGRSEWARQHQTDAGV